MASVTEEHGDGSNEAGPLGCAAVVACRRTRCCGVCTALANAFGEVVPVTGAVVAGLLQLIVHEREMVESERLLVRLLQVTSAAIV